MFFYDPPGQSDSSSLINYGDSPTDVYYILFHDQEPIHLDLHRPSFEEFYRRNLDINHRGRAGLGCIITSERDSADLRLLCEKYDWTQFYYFFHGWAALDWYRGYDLSSLHRPFLDRACDHSFLMPNRIIGGMRQHRVLLCYHLIKRQVSNAIISLPRSCPAEHHDIATIAHGFLSQFPDIVSVLDQAGLPWHLPREHDHPMTSYCLDRFDLANKSLFYVVTETVFFGRKNHLTEKTFKPICYGMPFVLVSNAGSLEYLRSYGFQTFAPIIDESYDLETDDHVRLCKIADLLSYLDSCTSRELTDLKKHLAPRVQHNYNHFYKGGFESILTTELKSLLTSMQAQCH